MLIPLLQITLHIQQCGQGIFQVLPITLLIWQLPALPTQSQHIPYPLKTIFLTSIFNEYIFVVLFPTLTLYFQISRKLIGNYAFPLPPLYQVKGPETCGTPSQEGLEFRDMYSDLPLCDGYTQARFPEGFQARKKFKAFKLCIKKMKDHILHAQHL